MTERPTIIASYIIIVTALALMLALAVLLFVPPKIISPKQDPYTIINKTVKAGENVYYVADLCKNVDTAAYVSRSLAGTAIYPLGETVSRISAGCTKNTVSVAIPLTVPPGRYSLHMDIRYEVNFLRHENYHLKTEEFDIVQ